MGNYLSCTLINPSSTSIRVVIPKAAGIRHISTGGARRALPAAADLMLDFPGHFVTSSRSLRVGARFAPLAADEELEPGSVYVMVPMSRVNSPVNASDLGPLLLLAAGKAARKGPARVIPENPPSTPPEAQEQQDEEVVEFRNRLSLCRSRRPRLETIVEETCACS